MSISKYVIYLSLSLNLCDKCERLSERSWHFKYIDKLSSFLDQIETILNYLGFLAVITKSIRSNEQWRFTDIIHIENVISAYKDSLSTQMHELEEISSIIIIA